PAEDTLGLAVELDAPAVVGHHDDDAAGGLDHRSVARRARTRATMRGGERPLVRELPPAAALERDRHADGDARAGEEAAEVVEEGRGERGPLDAERNAD